MAKDEDKGPSMGTATPYKGVSGIARDSSWLTADDLPEGRDLVLEIEEVRKRTGARFIGGKTPPVLLTLKFKGVARELRVNATIKRVLDRLFTRTTAEWWGKRVALYIEQDVDTPAGPKSAVRLRREVPKGAATPEAVKDPTVEPAGATAPVTTPEPERIPGSDG